MEPKTKRIILIVAVVIILLVLGLILTRRIFNSNTSNINSINQQMLIEMSDSLEQDENLVIRFGLETKKTATIERGTGKFGVALGFAPNNSLAWGPNKNGCKYNIEALKDECIDCCLNQGWYNLEENIFPGTTNQVFDEIQDGKGYALIRIDIPKDVEPCIQRFIVSASCVGYPNETASNYFNIQVIKKKGLF